MDGQRRQFIDKASLEAETAGHIFPTMAACEAALESRYGTSALAIADRNLFGMKQHQHPIYGTHILPTREFVGVANDNSDGIKDGWVTVNAEWITYPDWRSCFVDRMNTLTRLAHAYPNYQAALDAVDANSYVKAVSKTWSTDPHRAESVIEIFTEYLRLAAPANG